MSSAASSGSMGGGCGACSPPNTPAPICGAIVRNAVTRYVRKRLGSLSPSSSDSQATGRAPGDPGADQRGFPKAGRGREEGQLAVQPGVEPRDEAGGTSFGRRGGVYSLVAKIGVDIAPLMRLSHEARGTLAGPRLVRLWGPPAYVRPVAGWSGLLLPGRIPYGPLGRLRGPLPPHSGRK